MCMRIAWMKNNVINKREPEWDVNALPAFKELINWLNRLELADKLDVYMLLNFLTHGLTPEPTLLLLFDVTDYCNSMLFARAHENLKTTTQNLEILKMLPLMKDLSSRILAHPHHCCSNHSNGPCLKDPQSKAVGWHSPPHPHPNPFLKPSPCHLPHGQLQQPFTPSFPLPPSLTW